MSDFLRRRGPGLLAILILLFAFVGFMFSRGGLDIREPEYPSLNPHNNQASGTVREVYDGDTIKVQLNRGKDVVIRILGMDCPESKENNKCHEDEQRGWLSCEEQIPLGKRARTIASQLLLGDTVTLQSGTDQGFKSDAYGRGLAYVEMSDGTDFGLEMLRRGQCRDFSHAFPHPRMGEYRKANQPIKPLN